MEPVSNSCQSQFHLKQDTDQKSGHHEWLLILWIQFLRFDKKRGENHLTEEQGIASSVSAAEKI